MSIATSLISAYLLSLVSIIPDATLPERVAVQEASANWADHVDGGPRQPYHEAALSSEELQAMDYERDAWVEVDLAAIEHNVAQVRLLIGEGVRLMAVVKADGYGHGAVETSRAMVKAGADALAVTRLTEAAGLRRAGITSPILVFSPVQPSAAEEAVDLDVDLTVCTPELASALGTAARAAGATARVHLKVDTGMGRLGVLPADAPALARTIAATEGIILAGTYTHFATAAEKDLSRAREQLRRLGEAIAAIRESDIDPGIVHAANSAAILRLPESRFDMVRPGTILYGQYPSRYVPRTLDLSDTWRLKARISFIKTVPARHPIGYGAEFVTRRESRIAVIPLGWADGLTLSPESLARRRIVRLAAARIRREPPLWVTVRGRKAPVVGRIAMQMCSVDVTNIPEACIGDEVIVPARRATTSSLLPRVYTESEAAK
jgi:alanine racemase